MPKASPIKTSFNAGEFSPFMEGQITYQKYGDSCRKLQNMICLKQGPVVRRGGTRFIKEVKDSAKKTALIPFRFSEVDSYTIEAGDSYFRFYKDRGAEVLTAQDISGVTQANPAVMTYVGADNYANGDEVYVSSVVGMTELNGKFFLVANVNAGANTFELTDTDGNNIDSTSYTAYVSGGAIQEVFQVSSPFSDTDLVDDDYKYKFQYAQSADVLYIAHGDYKTRAMARNTISPVNFTIGSQDFVDGPYLPENDTTTTLTLSGTSGSVTVTASAVGGINGGDGFQTTDVGRIIRWHDGTNWTWLEITARTSTTVVTASFRGENAGATTATERWRLGVYSDTTGWPKVITFFQDRVFLAGCGSYPDRFDMTRTGGFSHTQFFFAPSDRDGTVTDDAAIFGTLQSGEVNGIVGASSDNRGLIVMTQGSEFLIRASTQNEVITPTNIKADFLSGNGGAYIQPARVDAGSLFIQRSRRKVMDIIYSLERDALKPRDITITSEHLTRSGVAQISYQQEPINCVWLRKTNGSLFGLTYYPEENVFGAHPHVIGGTAAKVRALCTNPAQDGSRDEVYMIVERTINSVTRQYIEVMERYYEDDIAVTDAFHVDSGLTYDGSATDTVSGLEHLEGETVKVMRDGKSHPDLVVEDGSVTLANGLTGSVIHVGLSNSWIVKPQRIEAGAADGTAQGKTKRITGLSVRLLNTLGLYYGPNESTYDEYDFGYGSVYDDATPLFSGDTPFLRWTGGYETDGNIYLQHDGVFPACILAIMPQVVTQDR